MTGPLLVRFVRVLLAAQLANVFAHPAASRQSGNHQQAKLHRHGDRQEFGSDVSRNGFELTSRHRGSEHQRRDETPAELGRRLGMHPELHARIYSGDEGGPLSPEGCRTLSYAYGCLGPGPQCNGELCGTNGKDQCSRWAALGLMPHMLMEGESTARALQPLDGYICQARSRDAVPTVMNFLCSPVVRPWWPRDPIVGPSPPLIADSPISLLARDLAGKILLMVGDSVTEQTCGAFVCGLRRDASLGAQRSQLGVQWQKALPRGTLDGTAEEVWEARETGFVIACLRMNQYNNQTFDSERRYRALLEVLKPDVLVANHGVHHPLDLKEYGRNMGEFFALVRSMGFASPSIGPPVAALGGQQLFLWASTTAQHFDTPKGDYDPTTQQESGGCFCSAKGKGGGGQGTAEAQAMVTSRLLAENGFTAQLPMHHLTRRRAELHNEACRGYMLRNASAPGCPPRHKMALCDCTHLCYSPAFFDRVAGSLRKYLHLSKE